MANWGRVKPLTIDVGGKVYTFRSKLEYRWAVWCQLRKEQGIITDWLYESEEVPLKYKTGRVDFYRPDFTIEYGRIKGRKPEYEFEETKGWFQAKDKTKMKLFAEQYDNPLTLIFAKPPSGIQYRRADGLVKLLESNGGRVIYDAEKTIFKPIKHLFEVC